MLYHIIFAAMEFVDKIEEQQEEKVSVPFMDFYFHFVVPNRSLIELERSAFVTYAIRSQFSRYASARWKKLCHQTVNGRVIGGEMYNLARHW